MEEMRQSTRFPIQLKARYLEKSNNEWYDFSTINISREGMGMKSIRNENFPTTSPFQSELILPSNREPILIAGDLMWKKEVNGNADSHIIGGVRFSRIDESSKLSPLDYALNEWYSLQRELEGGNKYRFIGILLILINIVILWFFIYTLLIK